MKILVTADLHLTDNPIEEYRWKVFDFLHQITLGEKVDVIFVLGDVTDRKDRHTGNLVNRLVDKFESLSVSAKAPIIITAGNHDAPLVGPYYWSFLGYGKGVSYIKDPTYFDENLWLLPFTPNPEKDWKDIDFSKTKAAFIHQTLQGVLVENDRILTTGQKLPDSMKNIPTFSGDVHRPQILNNIIYVGAPYPVKFSETWANRVLMVDTNNIRAYREIPVLTIRRAILDISSTEELKSLSYKKDDQLRIRYKLTADQLTNWPVEEGLIKKWCNKRGIILVSLEATLIGEGLQSSTTTESKELEIMKPEEIVRAFCKQEGLDQNIIEMGLELIKWQ